MRNAIAAVAMCLSTSALAQSINEIRSAQTGVDLQVYSEIAGVPGSSLDGLTYVVIGNDDFQLPPQQNGSIEVAIPLDGNTIPASGFFVMAEFTYTLTTPDLVTLLGFESDNNKTHMLVRDFVGFVGDDIDLNDDGVIDNAPWSEVVSDVALLAFANPDGLLGDYVYSTTTVGPDGGVFPSHAKKCASLPVWRLGFADTASGSDTPGEANPACGSGGGLVLLNEIRFDQQGADNDEYIELAGEPGTSLDGLTFLVLGDSSARGSGTVECIIPLDGYVMPASGLFMIALQNSSGQDGIAFGAEADLKTDQLRLENTQNSTFLLVRDYTGSTTQEASDVDTDNDGVIDAPLWSEILDAVAVKNNADAPTGTQVWWFSVALPDGSSSPVIGPDDIFHPVHVYRCSPQGSWKIGFFDPVAAGANNKDTPKAANPECAVCGDPGSGSCFEEHATPGCTTAGCCEIVCAFVPSCCDTGWDATCVSTALAQCLTGGEPPALEITEIRMRDPDNSGANEYIEIVGAPNTLLTGVTLVVVNKQDTGTVDPAGVIDTALSLEGQRIPSSGRFLITENTFNIPGVTPDLNAGGGLVFDDGGTLNFYLVWNFFGARNDDLDAENDGTLDSTPWVSVIDSVAVVGDSGLAYPPTQVGPAGGLLPAQVYKCSPDGTWTIGPIGVVAGYDTPGQPNTDCSLPRIFQCGDADAGDCFQPHGNGHCFNRPCCEAVCAVVPDCCDVIWDNTCVSVAGSVTACGGGSAVALLNEVRLDQQGDDNDEYVELIGTPGTSLDGLALIALGDGSVTSGGVTTQLGSGAVEMVIPLDGNVIPESGYFLITRLTETGSTPQDGIAIGVPGDLQTSLLNLENGDNVTLMLVSGFTGAVSDDLDIDNDGVLDSTPWTEMVDAVSVVVSIRPAPTSSQEWWYAPRIPPNQFGVVFQAYRCSPVGYWLGGEGVFTDPETATDTPGAQNLDCPDSGGGGNDCPGDLDGSGFVDAGDIGSLLILFGSSDPSADLDGSGLVDAGDIGSLLILFGPCSG